MRYALNNLPEPPTCWRCGQPAEVDWAEVTVFGEVEPMVVAARIWCATPGCVDALGRNTVVPPTPEQLDDEWLNRYRTLAQE